MYVVNWIPVSLGFSYGGSGSGYVFANCCPGYLAGVGCKTVALVISTLVIVINIVILALR